VRIIDKKKKVYRVYDAAAAAIPEFDLVEHTNPIAVTLWLAGIVGLQHKRSTGRKSTRSYYDCSSGRTKCSLGRVICHIHMTWCEGNDE
jgi:hypothetical protein